MKKKILAALLACCMCFSLAACGSKKEEISGGTEFKDGKFVETVKLTVEVYDRGNDGGSDPTNNMYTDFIKQGMKDTYNVEVEFVAVSRWEEVQQINNLLAGGTAPDICLTYDYPTIQTYAGMEGVLYRIGEITLNEGDRLFLYTDGVPEATNVENKLYGEDRLLTFMNENASVEAV